METRIKEVRQAFGLTQTEFADLLGVTGAAVSRWEAGVRDIPEMAVRIICQRFSIREEWLRSGAGEMRAERSRADAMAAFAAEYLAGRPDSFRTALIAVLLRFDPDGPEWAALERIYDEVAAELQAENPAEAQKIPGP